MRLRSHLRLLFVVCALSTGSAFSQVDSLAVVQPTVTPANLSMIQVSPGFETSTDFNGFINKNLGVSIVMTSIQDVTAQAMDDAWEQDSTRTLLKKTLLTSNMGDEIFLYKEEGNSGTVSIIQYTVFVGKENKVLWLSIAYPAIIDPSFEKDILQIIKSADLN